MVVARAANFTSLATGALYKDDREHLLKCDIPACRAVVKVLKYLGLNDPVHDSKSQLFFLGLVAFEELASFDKVL